MTSPEENHYIFDPENVTEMHRLFLQDTLLTKHIGMLAPGYNPTDSTTLLDLGCGPGGWTLEVAQHFPQAHVVGLDLSPIMIAFARHLTQTQRVQNVCFLQGNFLHLSPDYFSTLEAAYRPLYDYLNLRLVLWFLPHERRRAALASWLDLLKSGGTISLTEIESFTTNSLALNTLGHAWMKAIARHAAPGQSTASEDSYAITLQLLELLQHPHLTDGKQMAYIINYSYGQPDSEAWRENLSKIYALSQPFLAEKAGIDLETFDRLYAQGIHDLRQPGFRGVCFYVRAWAQKR